MLNSNLESEDSSQGEDSLADLIESESQIEWSKLFRELTDTLER